MIKIKPIREKPSIVISETKKNKQYFLDNYNPKQNIDVPGTAESLNVSRQTIYRWIKLWESMQP